MTRPCNVIITMAGFGRRFLEAGYSGPKYRLVAHGRTLFAWSIVSLRSFIEEGARFTFVVRAADESEAFIRKEAGALGIASAAVLEIDAPTDGQATTALLAGDSLADPTAPIAIYNIDTFVHPGSLPASAVRGAGWIPCFPGKGDAWSFVDADASGRARNVREKQRISPHATIGLYYFSSFVLYKDVYRRHVELDAKERYIAPMYNTLIADGADVFIHSLPYEAVIPLGVPADLERFTARTPPAV